MNTIKNTCLVVLTLVALAGLYVYIGRQEDPAVSGYSSQLNSHMASSSSITVGIQQNRLLFTAKDNCASRVISTGGQAIMLSFGSSTAPGLTSGHVQGASTTVAYDANLFGCESVTAYGHTASTTINLAEFTW